MRPIYDATLDALEPLADRALLDAGCGAGLALRLAADRGAVVSGLDASAPLLEVARGRLPGAGFHGVTECRSVTTALAGWCDHADRCHHDIWGLPRAGTGLCSSG
jgi:cyclopropane fatty-acyl-phospholipid synthase-like methyltransferase